MIKIPKLPEKEEVEFKEKVALLSLYEQVRALPKVWLILLLALLIGLFPLERWLQKTLTTSLSGSYVPPSVNLTSYVPKSLKILQTEILEVSLAEFSLVAQVQNPNADISVRFLPYEFVLKDAAGQILSQVAGQSYLSANESKFLVVPKVTLDSRPTQMDLKFGKIRWTKLEPKVTPRLEVLQESTGVTPEGKFFVEGIVKNQESFGLKKVDVTSLVFDSTNKNLQGVNATILTDLRPFESRYFRLIWPKVLKSFGEVQVLATVNLLDPGLNLEKPLKVPAR